MKMGMNERSSMVPSLLVQWLSICSMIVSSWGSRGEEEVKGEELIEHDKVPWDICLSPPEIPTSWVSKVWWECYSPTHWNHTPMDLVNFSPFLILSNHFRLRTVRRFPKGTHLSHTLHHFTNTCFPHGKPCFIKPNFILDSLLPCCAWLCCHTHAFPSCSCFHSATAMWLHHVINLCYACPRQYR